MLRGAGYQTMMTGKWHVTPNDGKKHNWPLQRGFDRFYGIIAGAASYYQPWTLTRDNDPIEPEGADFYLTDAIGRNAAAYIEDAANVPNRSSSTRHSPRRTGRCMPSRPISSVTAAAIKTGGTPCAGASRAHDPHGAGTRKWGLTPRDADVPAWKDAPDKEWQQRRMEVYAAQIDRMDRNVGAILDALRRTGRDQDTLILFLADNGGCAEDLPAGRMNNNTPKQTRDGRAVRPGNQPSVLPAATILSPVMASAGPMRRTRPSVATSTGSMKAASRAPDCELAARHRAAERDHSRERAHHRPHGDLRGYRRSALPREPDGQRILPMEGRSLAPAFQALKVPRNSPFFWEHEGNRAVIDGRWKLVSRYPNRWELYDLDADRCERRDLAASDPGRAERMSTSYNDWAGRCNVRPWDEVRKIPSTDAQ